MCLCVCPENNHYLSKDSWGVHIEKRAFYRVRFRALEILEFSSFKKRCPKVGLAFSTGRGRDPVLSPFWWTFSKKWKFTFYQKEFNLLGIWRKKSNLDNFECSKTSGLMEFCITNATFGWLTQYNCRCRSWYFERFVIDASSGREGIVWIHRGNYHGFNSFPK